MTIELERTALYAEVWRTPLIKLAPAYGLSDNGLRKICKKLNVPLPPQGHWNRVAAGRTVMPPPPLPNAFAAASVSLPNPRPAGPSPFSAPEDARWLQEQLANEREPALRVHYATAPTSWHPALVPMRDALRKAMVERAARKARKAALVATPRTVSGARADAYNWSAHFANEDSGGMLLHTHKRFCVVVSELTCERALAVLNAFFVAAEARNFTVTLAADRSRFELKLEEIGFTASIRERSALNTSGDAAAGRANEEQAAAAPRLALVLDRPSGPLEVTDTARDGVEMRLQEVFPRLFRAVVRGREDARERATRIRQADAARAERERLMEEREERLAREKLRVEEKQALISEANRWSDAKNLRAYLQMLSEHVGDSGGDDLKAWIRGAQTVADALDPSAHRLRSTSSAAPRTL